MSLFIVGSGSISIALFAFGFGVFLPVSGGVGDLCNLIAIGSGMSCVGMLDCF